MHVCAYVRTPKYLLRAVAPVNNSYTGRYEAQVRVKYEQQQK